MPYCFNCGEEIYLITKYLKVKDCYCEKCRANFSILEKGKASENELNRAYNDYQRNYYLNMKPGKTYRQIVGEMYRKEES